MKTKNEMTNYQMVREFHRAFNLDLDNRKPTWDLLNLRLSLIEEEAEEVTHELLPPIPHEYDRQSLAKELADLLYVTYGTAAALGIDIDAVFTEVHRSNMSKLDENGEPIYREDGKVLKGPNYRPANLVGLV